MFIENPNMRFSMKAITLVLAVAAAVSFSSCCCQSQPMPPLRPMPKDCGNEPEVAVQPVQQPVEVLPQSGK